MANIAELQEQYTGAAFGTTIAPANTIFESVSGSPVSNVFHDSRPAGSTSNAQRIVSGGAVNSESINRADITVPVSVLFEGFYLYVEAAFATNTAILNWNSGATKVGDLRVVAGASPTLQLRDAAVAQWTSTALGLGEWHRVEVKTDPGEATGHLVNIWSGANLHGTATPSQTSGPQTATGAGLATTATVSDVRFGLLSADSTGIVRLSRLRGNDAEFPAPVVAAGNTTPTAHAGPDQTAVPYQTVTLTGAASTDADGTIASYAWTQTAGQAVSLTGTGATRTFTAPPTTAGTTLTFSLVVTDNGGATSTADTVNVVVSRHNQYVVATDGTTRVPRRRTVK